VLNAMGVIPTLENASGHFINTFLDEKGGGQAQPFIGPIRKKEKIRRLENAEDKAGPCTRRRSVCLSSAGRKGRRVGINKG